jgi:tryptophan 7-halogenase
MVPIWYNLYSWYQVDLFLIVPLRMRCPKGSAFFISGILKMSEPLKIVIVGGGTAGWMAAAALVSVATDKVCNVVLIESDQISSVGVGEATLPQMKDFNDYIGINEADMMQKTNATFKLGIEFVNWGKVGNSYIHPFGKFGEAVSGVDFHQMWNKAKAGASVESIESYSFAIQACRQNRFEFPVEDQSEINSTYAYAYHFDAGLYAQYLRKFSEERGLKRIEGKIIGINQDPDSGYISSLNLESGENITGDYFLDCSGFQSLFMGKTLNAVWDDWSQWLVCDRAVAVQSERSDLFPPYTQSTAKAAGWQWRIPLQHRTGNGYVYGSDFISDDEAAMSLLNDLDAAPRMQPKLLKFKAGRFKKSWQKNCIAIGLASGFLEPLESTSIYLIQVAIINLLKLMPEKQPDDSLINEFNRLVDVEYERVRDFLILHYHLNTREDGEIWRYCRNMSIPDSLQQKMEMFKRRGYIDTYRYGLFAPPSWISVFIGQGLIQQSCDPYVNNLSREVIDHKLRYLSDLVKRKVSMMSEHASFIADYCPSKNN